ncbi:MAG: AAA family ATPase [Nocardioidaceae bacterium]
MAADAVRIRLAATLAVDAPDGTLSGRELGSRKARTLLALLAAERGRLVPVDRIVDVLWPDDPPADPAANVSTLVSRTRRLLGDALTSAPGRAYGLVGDGSWSVDLDEADALLDEADDRLVAGDHGLAAVASRRALELVGAQPALLDEPDAPWVQSVRREADALRNRGRQLLATALTVVEPAEAVEVAADAVETDPFDEQAIRSLMRAQVAAGRTTAALSTYDRLARRLRDELGTDPDRATTELHVAVLRETSTVPEQRPRPTAAPALIGREAEVAVLDRAWTDAGARTGRLLLVEGEAGIGKTRLLEALVELTGRSGGRVLRARCHPTERSLFLQPYVDALRPVLVEATPAAAQRLLRGHTDAWVGLLPELDPLVAPEGRPTRSPDLQRRRAYDGVAAVLRRLSHGGPVVLVVDDLQDGGAATVDLLGYLAERLRDTRVLLVGAVRSEDVGLVSGLADRATVVRLGSLPRSAVDALAAAAGLGSHSATVMERTAGHPLSVVECLRALASGDTGVPATLTEAVLARLARLDPEVAEVLGAGSVLGRRLDPRRLASLSGSDELSVVRHCEELARVRLLVRSDLGYEFVNDLVQEAVHAHLPPALAAAYHRRAADLTSDRPETMAAHAFASGDLERAARGWLLAGEAAMQRAAVDDAIVLFGRGLDAAEAPELRARLLLERARAREAGITFELALPDIDEALRLARSGSDRRLEMAALRARGGDVPVALRRPSAEIAAHLEAGLALASGLGDRRSEANFTTRLTVLECTRLRLADALVRSEAGLARARSSASPEARMIALDGVKTVNGYLGNVDRLADVVAELEPELRRRGHTWFLQWAVFDSAFVPASRGDWPAARARVEEAVGVNRRSGYPAYTGYFTAHLGWFDRLDGDLDAALRQGRRALAQTSPVDHPWWFAAAAGLLAATLVDVGRTEEAAEVARRGLATTTPDTPEAWRLRCLAPLAAATGTADDLAAAVEVLAGVGCPPGGAWVGGADCYLLVARASLARGDADAASRWLAPLADATRSGWAPVRRQVDALLAQISSATS